MKKEKDTSSIYMSSGQKQSGRTSSDPIQMYIRPGKIEG